MTKWLQDNAAWVAVFLTIIGGVWFLAGRVATRDDLQSFTGSIGAINDTVVGLRVAVASLEVAVERLETATETLNTTTGTLSEASNEMSREISLLVACVAEVDREWRMNLLLAIRATTDEVEVQEEAETALTIADLLAATRRPIGSLPMSCEILQGRQR